MTSKFQPSWQGIASKGHWNLGTEEAQWSWHQGQEQPKHSVISWKPFDGMPGSTHLIWDLLGSNYCTKHLIQRAENGPGQGQPKPTPENFPTMQGKVVSPRRSYYPRKLVGFPWGPCCHSGPHLTVFILKPARKGGGLFTPSCLGCGLAEKQKLCWGFRRMVQGPAAGSWAKEKWGDQSWGEEACHHLSVTQQNPLGLMRSCFTSLLG